jgi:hypothetical protein
MNEKLSAQAYALKVHAEELETQKSDLIEQGEELEAIKTNCD